MASCLVVSTILTSDSPESISCHQIFVSLILMLSLIIKAYTLLMLGIICTVNFLTFKLKKVISLINTIRVANILDPDQARQNVGPDLGPNS